MIRVIFIIIAISMFFTGCGIKDNPEYKSSTHFNRILYKV